MGCYLITGSVFKYKTLIQNRFHIPISTPYENELAIEKAVDSVLSRSVLRRICFNDTQIGNCFDIKIHLYNHLKVVELTINFIKKTCVEL